MKASREIPGLENAVVSATTAIRVIAARADVAYVFSSLVRIHAKGNFGEAYAQHYFIRNKLGESISGRWTSLTPRAGRQGFDHLFLRRDGNKLYWMVCESKYNTSPLGYLKDGTQQMSWKWLHDRAAKLGEEYLQISAGHVEAGKLPWLKSGIKTLDVPLSNGGKATFWKGRDGQWRYSGPRDKMEEARRMAGKMGMDLKSDTCNIRGRLFRITASGNDVKISVYQVESAKGSTQVQDLKYGKTLTLKNVLDKHLSDEELKKAIAEEIRKKFPSLSPSEVREITEEIASKKTNGSLLREAMSTTSAVALQSLAAAGIAGGIDILAQLALKREVDWKRVGMAAGAAAAGTATGQVVSILLVKTKSGIRIVRFASKAAKLKSASLMRNSLAGAVGAVFACAVCSCGMVWLGKSEWNDAHQEFVAGVGGVVGGGGVVTLATSLVVAFGHAGTGAAIAGLGGIAQTKAALAWIGRVLLGGGVRVGSMALGVLGVATTIAIQYAISYGFRKRQEAKTREYMIRKGELYDGRVWDVVAHRTYLITGGLG